LLKISTYLMMTTSLKLSVRILTRFLSLNSERRLTWRCRKSQTCYPKWVRASTRAAKTSQLKSRDQRTTMQT